MKTTIQKWGKSLAIRIPTGLARDTQLHDGTAVEMAVDGNRLVIQSASRKQATLSELLKQVTPARMHSETDWGAPRGHEVW